MLNFIFVICSSLFECVISCNILRIVVSDFLMSLLN